MYIEEIILDGFKSYANRTVISGWDRDFNAITGLNGSGKSNILDAICFVLGIDNLRQVRATTLNDLVYKRGQTGVTKATVSIVFNNQDTSKSPIGYGDSPKITVTRQVVIGGKNKYLINGHVVQQKNVETLFQSVHLNVNNPHFLIMQGQITKVLNMKGAEILALIEEAAGTKMYEDRKEKAVNSIDKKERKLQEITNLLDQVIRPKLVKLKAERASYFEHQRLETELVTLQALMHEYEYLELETNVMQLSQQKETVELECNEGERTLAQLKEQIQDIQQAIQQKTKSIKKSQQLLQAENEITQTTNEITRVSKMIENGRKAIEDENKELEILNKELGKNVKSLKDKRNEEQVLVSTNEEEKIRIQQLNELLRASNLQDAQAAVTQSMEDTRASIARSRDSIANLSDKLARSTGKCTNLKQIEQEIANEEAFLLENKSKIVQIQSLMNEKENLDSQKNSLRAAIRSNEQRAIALKNNFYSLEFAYEAPGKGFDKSNVHGTFVSLVSPKDAGHHCALEVCAGGRLYNVVVANEHIASQLLDRNRFQRRITFIPLNKIVPYVIPPGKVEKIKASYEGFVDLASNMVDYDKKMQPAVDYVLGGCFICSSKETAKKIAFEQKCKAVTFDGDVYDPSGTLTGGSRKGAEGRGKESNEASSPFNYATLNNLIAGDKQQLQEIEAKLSAITADIDSLQSLRKEIHIKTENVAFLKKKLADVVNGIEEQEGLQNALQLEAEKLKQKEVELAQISNSSVQDILKQNGEAVAQLERSIRKNTKAIQYLQLEIKQLEADVETNKKSIANRHMEINQHEKEISIGTQSLSNLESSLLTLRREFEKEKQEYERKEKEIQSLKDSLIATKQQQVENEHLISSLHRQLESIVPKLKEMKEALQQLSKPAAHRNPPLTKEEYEEIRHSFQALSKKMENIVIDPQGKGIMEMIDALEKKESNLSRMLQTVIKDKEKISQTIVKLNTYKRNTLTQTISKVDADFCDIFAKLLPGKSAAKFQKVASSEESIEGLEIKVSLDGGNTWKNSLTELSGGQRSLVALSLILALLKYSPAPVYILDEIDAALDLSHTQNIGMLLKSGIFNGSQFIVVSLKDGMFSNANVLFKTNFKDGISNAERLPNK